MGAMSFANVTWPAALVETCADAVSANALIATKTLGTIPLKLVGRRLLSILI